MSKLKPKSDREKTVEKSDLEVIRSWYKARNEGIFIDELFAPDVVWEVAEGFPHGGIYNGSRSVIEDFFPLLAADFQFLRADLSELLDAGSLIVGIGDYNGQTKSTKRIIAAPFVHLWRVKNQRIAWFRNYTDTKLFADALGE